LKPATGLEILGRLMERADVLILNQPSRAAVAPHDRSAPVPH